MGALATFQVFSKHMWLVANVLHSIDTENFSYHKEFYWMALV